MGWSTAVPWVLTLGTILVGIWQFTTQQEQANRQEFLKKQLEISFDAANAAAVLASGTDPAKWEEARSTFWRLYWGPLTVVEDRDVEAAMVQLGRLVPKEPVAEPRLPMASLQGPAYRLAHALRQLVLNSWDVSLPALEGDKAIPAK